MFQHPAAVANQSPIASPATVKRILGHFTPGKAVPFCHQQNAHAAVSSIHVGKYLDLQPLSPYQ